MKLLSIILLYICTIMTYAHSSDTKFDKHTIKGYDVKTDIFISNYDYPGCIKNEPTGYVVHFVGSHADLPSYDVGGAYGFEGRANSYKGVSVKALVDTAKSLCIQYIAVDPKLSYSTKNDKIDYKRFCTDKNEEECLNTRDLFIEGIIGLIETNRPVFILGFSSGSIMAHFVLDELHNQDYKVYGAILADGVSSNGVIYSRDRAHRSELFKNNSLVSPSQFSQEHGIFANLKLPVANSITWPTPTLIINSVHDSIIPPEIKNDFARRMNEKYQIHSVDINSIHDGSIWKQGFGFEVIIDFFANIE